jgi:hypothetical protein
MPSSKQFLGRDSDWIPPEYMAVASLSSGLAQILLRKCLPFYLSTI